MARRNGKTTRLIDQVLQWCLEGVPTADGDACPTIAIMCADSRHVQNLKTQFISRAQDVGMTAEISHLDEVHLWTAIRGKRYTVAFMPANVNRGPRPYSLSGVVRIFADHYAVQSQLMQALESFGSAFSGADPYQTILRAVAELVPEQYREKE